VSFGHLLLNLSPSESRSSGDVAIAGSPATLFLKQKLRPVALRLILSNNLPFSSVLTYKRAIIPACGKAKSMPQPALVSQTNFYCNVDMLCGYQPRSETLLQRQRANVSFPIRIAYAIVYGMAGH
jgi:hypothetical protein